MSLNFKEITLILSRLYQLRDNKDKIKGWRPSQCIKIGISSYTFYKLSAILEREGVLNGKEINWQKLDELIAKLEKSINLMKSIEEELEDRDFDYDPYYEQFVSYELKKKEGQNE